MYFLDATPAADMFDVGWDLYTTNTRHHSHGQTSPTTIRLLFARKLVRDQWQQQWLQIKETDVWRFESWLHTCPDPNRMEAIMRQCESNDWDLWVALEWIFASKSTAPKLPSDTVLHSGVTPQELKLLRSTGLQGRYSAAKGHRGTVSLIFALQGLWGASGMTLKQARRWRMNNFYEPEEAAGWRKSGFSASEAAMWKESGFGVNDAIADALMIAAKQTTVAVDDDESDWHP